MILVKCPYCQWESIINLEKSGTSVENICQSCHKKYTVHLDVSIQLSSPIDSPTYQSDVDFSYELDKNEKIGYKTK